MDSNVQKFPNIKINYESEETLKIGAAHVVSKIRSHWPVNEFQYKIFTDGISNKLIGIFLKENKNDMVLVRVYGAKTELIIDRNAEIRNMMLLNKAGCGCQLYAIFGNGLCYEYLPGDILTIESAKNPAIYPLVASAMAYMHKNVQLGPEVSKEPYLWHTMKKFIDILSKNGPLKDERLAKNNITLNRLEQEVQLLEKTLGKCSSPLVFTHNDLLLANIIVNKDEVNFIDYEYGGYNYHECDIANHFDEMAGVEDMDFVKDYPTKAFQLKWIECYLTKFDGGMKPSESRLMTFYENVNKFSLCYHMMWGMWGLVQSQISKIEFDFVQFGLSRLLEYFRVRDERL